jgi:hypothetical protein
MAALNGDTTPLDPDVVDAILQSWRHRRPADAPELARRWLAAKQEGLIDDDDLAVLMAIRLGDAKIPDDRERLERLVHAGWCLPPD